MRADELLQKFGLPPDALANLRTPVFSKALYENSDHVAAAEERTLQHLRTEYLARTGRVAEIDPAWIAEAAEQARANLDCNISRIIRTICDFVMLRSPSAGAKTDAEHALILLGASASDSVFKLRRDIVAREVVWQAVLRVQNWQLDAAFDVARLDGIATWDALMRAYREAAR